MTRLLEPRVVKLAAPIFVELGLQIALQVVDALMLSRVSDTAAGTVGILVTFFGLLMTLLASLAQAGSIRLSFALGAHRHLRAAHLRWVMVFLAFMTTVPIAVTLFLWGEPLLAALYGLDGRGREYTAEYMSVASWSVVTLGVSLVLNSFLRSMGKPYWSLPGALLANLVNAVLAYEFVSHGFGVRGVAWATLIAQGMMLAWTACVALRVLRIRITAPRSRRALRLYLSHLLSLFSPVVAEPLAYQSSQVAIGIIIARLGSEAMAARSYAGSIYAFCLLWSISLGQAAQFLVSHELGRRDQTSASAALKSCLVTAVLAGTGLALALALSSGWLLQHFTSNETVARNAQLLLWIAFFVEAGRASNIVVGAALKAAGDAAYPAKIGLLFMVGLSVPLAAFLGLSMGLGIVGVGLAMGADELARGILNFRRWKSRQTAPASTWVRLDNPA